MLRKILAFVGDNAIPTEASDAEEDLRENYPELLLDDENVVIAFKDRGGAGRDASYFTSQRILIWDVKGMTGKRVKYVSIPCTAIKAFSVETAGGSLDTDCTLHIWSSGMGDTSMDFVKGVDVFALKRRLNEMVLVEGSTGAHVPVGAVPTTEVPQEIGDGRVGGFLDCLGDDASQIDAGRVEQQLKTDPGILMHDEKVEMAFKCGRDSFVLTSKRILRIDVKGVSGKRIEYQSILWKCVRAFSMETAGSIDRDAELMLFTNISSMPRIPQDLRKGRCDTMAIQKFFTDKLLGLDTVSASEQAVSAEGHIESGSGSMFAWMGDDSRMIDVTQMDRQYHSNPPILQNSEHVEMAFKGRRDLTLFTTKRLLIVDIKGWSGKKVNYMSFPWTTVQAFGVRSAGSWMDKDSEMLIWTDINDIDYPQGEPIPRNSYLEMDFQKDKVDLMAIHRYLTARCLRLAKGGYLPPEVPVAPEVMQASPPDGVDNFLSWLGGDARIIDAREIDQQLHSVNPMLQVDEHVVMAFQVGRDMIVFTTKRLLLVDVQGFSGKRVEWKSVPYTSLRAFAVESAGSWDRDAEVYLYCKTYWINGAPGSVISQDLRKGRADIIAMQSFLAAQVFGAEDGSTSAPAIVEGAAAEAPGGIDAFLSWLGDDAHEIEASDVDKMLHTSPPILQSDESVDLCYKVGRDMCIFTTKRVVFVDVQGWSGKKVSYTSYPLRYCVAFEVQSAGSIGFFHSAHATVYTDAPGSSVIRQDLTKSEKNIWDIQTMMAKKLLRHGNVG